MSDINTFLASMADEDRDYAGRKQRLFEHRVISKLLRGLESVPGMAKTIILEAGDELDLLWLLSRFDSFPVKLGTFKADRCVPIPELLKCLKKTPVWKAYEETRDNYSGLGVRTGLAFGSEGDGFDDLIIHDAQQLPRADGHWRISLPRIGTVTPYIETLKGFIESIKVLGWQFK